MNTPVKTFRSLSGDPGSGWIPVVGRGAGRRPKKVPWIEGCEFPVGQLSGVSEGGRSDGGVADDRGFAVGIPGVPGQGKLAGPERGHASHPRDASLWRIDRNHTVDQDVRPLGAAKLGLVEPHAAGRFEPAIEEDDSRCRHHSASCRENQRAVFPDADLSSAHPIVGAFNVDILEVGTPRPQEHGVQPAEEGDVLVDVPVTRSLQRHALRDDVRSPGQIFARIAGILVVGIAVVDDGQVLRGESDRVDIEDVAVVFGALHQAAIVRQYHRAAIVGQAQQGDVVFRDAQACSPRSRARKPINVGLDPDDGRPGFRTRGRGSIRCLQRPEFSGDRIVLRQIAVDQIVIAQPGRIDADDRLDAAFDVVLRPGKTSAYGCYP